MKKIFFGLCAIMLITLSCKKDKSETAPTINKQNIAGKYKIDSMVLRYSGTTINYIDSLLYPCQKDDIITFNTDGSYIWSDQGTQCNPSGGDTPGTWDLPSTNKFILDSALYDLDKYDGKSLDISQSDTYNGQVATFAIKFKKQ